MPSLEGASEWINGKPLPSEYAGCLVLVYFWALSCPVCHETLPKLNHLSSTLAPEGLQVILIHCPRMKTDGNTAKVKEVIASHDITDPCGIDTFHKLKWAFQNEVWPGYYLFNREGKLKRRTAGKAGLIMLEPLIQKLIELGQNL
jgi:thiol-disulfide isomerase/thioredoxin